MDYKPVKNVQKPWGKEIWLCVEEEYAGKILEIRKGHRTSMQYHKKKKESMYVLSGTLRIETNKGNIIVRKGESITLNPGDRHRLCADEDVTLIEVSTPQLDDVVREEDDYGRK
jgi:mannose-6-phosphate isomerase